MVGGVFILLDLRQGQRRCNGKTYKQRKQGLFHWSPPVGLAGTGRSRCTASQRAPPIGRQSKIVEQMARNVFDHRQGPTRFAGWQALKA
jgi:hypothetical protein